MLMMEYGLDDRGKEVQAKFWGTEEQSKRRLKVKYINAPLFNGHYQFQYTLHSERGFWMEKIYTLLQGFYSLRCQK